MPSLSITVIVSCSVPTRMTMSRSICSPLSVSSAGSLEPGNGDLEHVVAGRQADELEPPAAVAAHFVLRLRLRVGDDDGRAREARRAADRVSEPATVANGPCANAPTAGDDDREREERSAVITRRARRVSGARADDACVQHGANSPFEARRPGDGKRRRPRAAAAGEGARQIEQSGWHTPGAVTPAFSTASSHACSLSCRRRRHAIQASGLNQ